jgi:acyl-CoA thioester hydrolase
VKETPVFVTRLRVRYVETDAMGVAHHSSFFIWMEVARVEFFNAHGMKYSDFEKSGFALPVAEVFCKYRKPVHFEDELDIRMSILKLTDVSMKIGYEIVRQPGNELVADGYTYHPVVDKQNRITRLPPAMKEFFLRNSDTGK